MYYINRKYLRAKICGNTRASVRADGSKGEQSHWHIVTLPLPFPEHILYENNPFSVYLLYLVGEVFFVARPPSIW